MAVIPLNGHEISIENLNQFYNKIQKVQKRRSGLWYP